MSRQILIAGDSTVTNRESTRFSESDCSHTGWGQMLPLYLGTEYKVKNYAKSGLTTTTFRDEGFYTALLENLKPNDYVLFQFGHNDQKREALRCNEGYKENLLRYINEIKSKNATPILITPLARNSFFCSTGEYNDLLFEYANTVKELAKETETFLVDLHKVSKEWIIKEGREKVKPYFFPGDFTHTNDYGAFKVAGFVYEQLKDFIKPYNTSLPWTDVCPSKIPEFIYEDSDKNLTREEALRLVRELCSFFAKNDEILSNENKEIISATQNGYLLFTDKLDQFITEKDFVKLLKLSTSAREIIPPDLFPEKSEFNTTITRKEALEYIEIYENKLNYRKNKKNPEIAGS